MKRKPPASNYEVGYCRPPLHTRFKPGQSGNPKGRPKRRKASFNELLFEALDKSVTIRADGKVQRTTIADAFVQGLVADAVRGKTAERKLLAAILSSQQANDSIPAFEIAGATERLKQKLLSLYDAKKSREKATATKSSTSTKQA